MEIVKKGGAADRGHHRLISLLVAHGDKCNALKSSAPFLKMRFVEPFSSTALVRCQQWTMLLHMRFG